MRRIRRPQPPDARRRVGNQEPDLPSLHELERFSEASLHRWRTAKNDLDALKGSLKGDGGRFNIGSELSPGTFTPFPALYIAEDYSTAFRERFGGSDNTDSKKLSASEMALRTPSSFSQVRLHGSVEQIIDAGDLNSLRPFTEVLKGFPVPKNVRQIARRLGLSQTPWLIRSPITLQRQLLHSNWRMLPVQFDLPSNSQIFARLVSAAGLHGILYPSARQHGKSCLALFPQNWANSSSNIQISDGSPKEARLTKIDGRNT